jgi:tetratricopeptide (TPR) repeat protein
VVAEAAMAVAAAQEAAGDYPAAVTTLADAYFAALEAGADRVALLAASRSAFLLAERVRKVPDARPWVRQALALLGRTGLEGAVAANVHDAAGAVAVASGELERARAEFEAAAGFAVHLDGADALRAVYTTNLATVAAAQGRRADAVVLNLQALAEKERALGPVHPSVALTLNNLGNAHREAGSFDEGRRALERARDIWVGIHGERHPILGYVHNNLGELELAAGRLDEARTHLAAALALREELLGRDHPLVAHSAHQMAAVYEARGELQPARELLERTLAIRAAASGDPLDLAKTRFALARSLWPDEASRPRAHDLATQARSTFVTAGERATKDRDAVDGWLAERR